MNILLEALKEKDTEINVWVTNQICSKWIKILTYQSEVLNEPKHKKYETH